MKHNPGCKFIATNLDAAVNLTDAQQFPGNGTLVAAVAAAAGREPTVVGKPSMSARSEAF